MDQRIQLPCLSTLKAGSSGFNLMSWLVIHTQLHTCTHKRPHSLFLLHTRSAAAHEHVGTSHSAPRWILLKYKKNANTQMQKSCTHTRAHTHTHTHKRTHTHFPSPACYLWSASLCHQPCGAAQLAALSHPSSCGALSQSACASLSRCVCVCVCVCSSYKEWATPLCMPLINKSDAVCTKRCVFLRKRTE